MKLTEKEKKILQDEEELAYQEYKKKWAVNLLGLSFLLVIPLVLRKKAV